MPPRTDHRERIIAAAAELLRSEGRDGVTTRSVAAAAGVQPPTIYRLFTDMAGLLEAVAADGFERYLHEKEQIPRDGDPVENLRRGWDRHNAFGLENPAHYLLMYSSERSSSRSESARRARSILRALIDDIAEAGLLVVDPELAVGMVLAANRGVTLTLIGTDPADRDPNLSPSTREAMIAAITHGAAPASAADREPARRAVALRSVLDESTADLSPGERALLGELLARIADAAGSPGEGVSAAGPAGPRSR